MEARNFSFDAGLRLRSSIVTTLFDGKTLYEDDANLFNNAGTGSGSFSNNKLSMTVTNGQYYVRQSNFPLPYFSGKSQLIEITCDNFQNQTGVTKRIGYFSSSAVAPYTADLDGFFIESSGGTYYLKVYNHGTEIYSVAFEDWDAYETLRTYDWSKFTVAAFDFLWLGGAILRLFIKTDDDFVLAHSITHAGAKDDVFIRTPHQFIRYEIRGDSAGGTMDAICSQVATEGGFVEAGKPDIVLNESVVACNSVGTVYALLGVRKRTDRRNTAVRITGFSIVNSTPASDIGQVLILKNPTVAGTFNFANVTGTAIQSVIGTSSNTVTGGSVIAAVSVGADFGAALAQNVATWLAMSLNNTQDSYVLAYRSLSTTQSVAAVLELREY